MTPVLTLAAPIVAKEHSIGGAIAIGALVAIVLIVFLIIKLFGMILRHPIISYQYSAVCRGRFRYFQICSGRHHRRGRAGCCGRRSTLAEDWRPVTNSKVKVKE